MGRPRARCTAYSSLITIADVQNSGSFSSLISRSKASYRLATSATDLLVIIFASNLRVRSWLELAPMSFSASKHRIDEESIKRFPLAQYAATHLADRAGFGNVISHIAHGIDHLLDADKPHFAVRKSRRSDIWGGCHMWATQRSTLANLA